MSDVLSCSEYATLLCVRFQYIVVLSCNCPTSRQLRRLNFVPYASVVSSLPFFVACAATSVPVKPRVVMSLDIYPMIYWRATSAGSVSDTGFY